MRELKELKLPQLVEARRRESTSSPTESPVLGHSHQFSQSSTMSDLPSPTFSSRGSHSRMQSSTSSLPSSPNMAVDADPFGTSKRPLTDVKEEPLERDEDFEMIDSFRQEDEYREPEFHPRLSQHEWSLDDPEVIRIFEDMRDATFDNPLAKRQRPDPSPLSGLASKAASRMPSFSRKWRSRKASPTVSIPPLSREPSVSRANSTRAPSIASAHGNLPPPTPAASVRNESVDNAFASSFAGEASIHEDADLDLQPKPTTPLLPPLVTDHISHAEEEPCQSPLQSPSVAEPGASSILNSPTDAPHTPQIPGYPSPPLSTKPSIASFHHRPYATIQSLVPSSEIPPMHINEISADNDDDHHPSDDKWADLLGHSNFTIHPTPYLPSQDTDIDLSTAQTLRADWDTARANFAKHLMRVEEHSGPTSQIYQLTQEKWTEIDAEWKANVNECVARLNSSLNSASASKSTTTNTNTNTNTSAATGASGSATHPHGHGHSSSSPVMGVGGIEEPVGRHLAKTPPLVKIPALNGPKSTGKFPIVGDEGIVGPMEVGPMRVEVREQQERESREKRKRKLGSYIKDWLVGVGMFGGSK